MYKGVVEADYVGVVYSFQQLHLHQALLPLPFVHLFEYFNFFNGHHLVVSIDPFVNVAELTLPDQL